MNHTGFMDKKNYALIVRLLTLQCCLKFELGQIAA